jgi:hypothetical protein
MPSTKTPLRFVSIAAGICLLAAPAFAQDAPEITLRLSPAQVAEIIRLGDLEPLAVSRPDAFWELQSQIADALAKDPAAMSAFLEARRAAR